MIALYNEIEPYAVQWLRNLEREREIAAGEVYERSIEDLTPAFVARFAQFHTFAGIGGWSLALRIAGWPDDEPVWTGSCPCQPFSSASRGRGGGFDSPKHLWPIWRNLIEPCRPSIVLGEQVATGDGYVWLARVADDFKAIGYDLAVVDLCSSVLHLAQRQRIFFAAYAHGEGQCARRFNAEMARVSAFARLARDERPNLHRVVQESDGFPGAMGQRRAYGNAVNPALTAMFVSAVIDTL
jgi:DNA (cytosine-5)-methyltransferase 1